MDVYEFEKCLLDRLEESMDVLSWKDGIVPASRVRVEWSCFIELQIEPAGWQALWKIPRVICEEMKLRYPTVVFGTVEQVYFKELKAIFLVLAVQDDDVHLPEKQEVNLEDLWPTKLQENDALNVERTADCIDRLRFFYTHLWMPWDIDEDDDQDWVEKHLESRVNFCYALKKKTMKRAMAAHIRTILSEARYLQWRREYIEMGLSDNEWDDILDKTQITDLTRLHLRLATIKGEVEMLENPELRRFYEQVKFDESKFLKHGCSEKSEERKPIAFIVTAPYTFDEQMTLLKRAGDVVGRDNLIQMCPSLQEVLNICNSSDNIYLPPGRHAIKFLEYLNDGGSIFGLCDAPQCSNPEKICDTEAVIMSHDDDSILLVFDGNFKLTNLTIDCRNIRSGILIKNGKVTLDNCKIIGDGKSSTQQGIMCSGNSILCLQDCILEDFSNGIVANDCALVNMKNCNILNCRIGIDVGGNSTIRFEKCEISKSKKCGLYFETNALNNKAEGKTIQLSTLDDLSQYMYGDLPWSGDCEFTDCGSNVYILNEKEYGFPKTLECILSEDNRPTTTKNKVGEKEPVNDSDIIEVDDSVIEINCDSE